MVAIEVLFFLYLSGRSSANYVPPTVELDSCMNVAAHFTISNMTSGGLIYIRTYKAFNVLPTVDGTMQYSCPFEDCGISFNSKFTLVVQRRVILQSTDDVLQTFVCMNDINPIFTIGSASGDSEDLNVTQKLYKPEVAMAFYRNGVELPGGSTIKLGSRLNITIEVTNNFAGVNETNFFDIDVRSCYLSTISLVGEFCPVHEDVFGLFTRVSNGNLTNGFNMFRPTTTTGNSVDLVFSCVLKVCMGTCEQGCNTGASGRRRRRDADDKLLEDGTEVDDGNLYVGKMFTVVTEEVEEEVKETKKRAFCLHIAVVIAMLACLSALLLFSISSSIYLTCQVIRQNKPSTTDQTDTKPELPSPNNNNNNCQHVTEDHNSTSSGNEMKEISAEDGHSIEQEDGPSVRRCNGIENKSFKSDEPSNGSVLYTNKERRRSRPLEVPLLHLQNAIAKIAPNSRAAGKVIVYEGVEQASPDSSLENIQFFGKT